MLLEPQWFMEFKQLRQEDLVRQERLRQEELLRQQQQLFRRTSTLNNGNIALESFALPNGIRTFLKNEADRIKLKGYVRRTHHTHVEILYEGNIAQLDEFLSILKRLESETVVESLDNSSDSPLTKHLYQDFSIRTNEHIRCYQNANSDGEMWEKKSSSIGSNYAYFPGGY